jgi:hypothetical protein
MKIVVQSGKHLDFYKSTGPDSGCWVPAIQEATVFESLEDCKHIRDMRGTGSPIVKLEISEAKGRKAPIVTCSVDELQAYRQALQRDLAKFLFPVKP